MSTTTQLVSDVLAAQVAYHGAVASKFSQVATALNQRASILYVDQKISDLIGMAPTTLDTLSEIASQIITNGDSIAAINSAISVRPTTTVVEGMIADAVASINYSSLQTADAANTAAIQVVAADLVDLDDRVDATESAISILQSSADASGTNIFDLQSTVSGHTQDLLDISVILNGHAGAEPPVEGLLQQVASQSSTISDVYTLAESHTGLIIANTSAIATKASQASLDSAVGRVATLETSVGTLTTTKASIAYVDTQLAGYATLSGFNAAISDLESTKAEAADLVSLDSKLEIVLTNMKDNMDAAVTALNAITF